MNEIDVTTGEYGQSPTALASLYKKMACVMADITRVSKSGRNKFYNYDYATESDVADLIRPLMAKNSIALIVSMLEYSAEPVATKQGETMFYHVKFMMTLADGDTGATINNVWYGEALDNQDKGLSKAATAAAKYFLMKTFIVSTGDEEPDGTGVDGDVAVRHTTRRQSPTPPPPNGDDPHKAIWEKFGKLFNHRQHFDNFIAKHGAGLSDDQLTFKIIALVDMPARLAKHDVKLTEAQRDELGNCEDYDALKIRVLKLYGCQTADEIDSAAKALTITVTDSIRSGVLLTF